MENPPLSDISFLTGATGRFTSATLDRIRGNIIFSHKRLLGLRPFAIRVSARVARDALAKGGSDINEEEPVIMDNVMHESTPRPLSNRKVVYTVHVAFCSSTACL